LRIIRKKQQMAFNELNSVEQAAPQIQIYTEKNLRKYVPIYGSLQQVFHIPIRNITSQLYVYEV
jgi:hypothetical protein